MLKKCMALWREAHFEVKMFKTPRVRTTFGSWDVEKVHAVVARSTFPSQNVQSTPFSDHFWKLRCRKSARHCGAKHISKWICTKHHMFAPLLEVRMLKKCTPLWHEAHFQVKMYKTHHVRTIFGGSDVEKVHAVVARSTFPIQNVQSTPCTDHFWSFRCSFAWRFRCSFVRVCSIFNHNHHYTTRHSNTLHYTTTTTKTTPSLHSTTLHYTTPHSITLNYTTLHYTTFHYTSSHYTTLHYTTLHYITLQLQLHKYTPLHSTTLHRYIKLHYTTLHYTARHSTTLHYTTLHYTTLPSTTTLHYTTLNYTTTTTTTTLHYTRLQLHSTTLHYTRLH